MNPHHLSGAPRRPGHPHPHPASPSAVGLPAAAIRQRLEMAATQAAAATRYDLSVLRLGGQAPPTLPRGSYASTRDGDLAQVDARMRYEQVLLTAQQTRAQARQAQWQALLAGQLPTAPPQASSPPRPATTTTRPKRPGAGPWPTK